MANELVFCIVCLSPRDMSDDGLVEKCEHCGDDEYVRSDFYVPDGQPFYGYIAPNKVLQSDTAIACPQCGTLHNNRYCPNCSFGYS